MPHGWKLKHDSSEYPQIQFAGLRTNQAQIYEGTKAGSTVTMLSPAMPRISHRLLRLLGLAAVFLTPVILFTYKSCLHDGHNVCTTHGQQTYRLAQLHSSIPDVYYKRLPKDQSIDVVVATVAGDGIDWLYNVNFPIPPSKLSIKKYVADSPTAPYHPPKNKGREATMYFSYILAHYDQLPDIAIFVHAHESPWHTETPLLSSMTETLNLLDLDHVHAQGFVNLRTGWQNACPAWIRTDVPEGESSKREEPFMRRAFVENFTAGNTTVELDPTGTADNEGIPRVLSAPCCSQFAVTKETMLRRSRAEYQRYLDNLLRTELTDYIYGRTWEHMWQYLFLEKPVDCPVEWKTLCAMYHVCFESAQQLVDFVALGWEQENLQYELSAWQELRHPRVAAEKRRRIAALKAEEAALRTRALERGLSGEWRRSMGDIYAD